MPGQAIDLTQRILDAARPVVLVHGPAASGKTTAALELTLRGLSAPRRCLLVAPNAPALRRLVRGLLERSARGVVVSPPVATFSDLAQRILVHAAQPSRLVSPLGRHLLLRGIVDRLLQEGHLKVLSAVADTPGLVEALERTISELKSSAIEPEDLARVAGQVGKHAELAEIYRRYQEHLRANRLYDVEGRVWEAARQLERSGVPAAGLAQYAQVVVDGFADFTPTQLALLEQVSRHVELLVITLPYVQQRGAERMWAWSRKTYQAIRETFGTKLAEVEAQPVDPPPSLAPLWERLFDYGPQPPLDWPDSLRIIAAPDLEAEVTAVARRVKQRLVEGAPAGSIAVLARSLEAYQPLVERVFRACDIPAAGAPQMLSSVPVARFALAVAGLGPRFAYNDVLAAVGSSYFDPAALGAFDAATVAAAQALIREGGVLEGRRAYRAAAERLAARLGEQGDDEPSRSRWSAPQLLQAAAMLDKLFEVAQAGSLAEVISAMQLPAVCARAGEPELIARDLRALAQLQAALREIPLRLSPAGLREALSAVRCGPARAEAVVDVLSVTDGRALRYEHVFCLGLAEGQFPQPFREGSLIRENDRQGWRSRGLRLDDREDVVAREMLLLYLAVSRAQGTLTLSYSGLGAAGAPATPSSFLATLLGPVGGLEAAQRMGAYERVSPGRFVPPAAQIAQPAEALLAAVAGRFDPDLDPEGAALGYAARGQRVALEQSAAGLWARHRRLRAQEFDTYDGRIEDDSLRQLLSRRFGQEAVFSPSQLNTFSQCPWLFFATYVLGLEPLAAPRRQLQAAEVGQFCHAVLYRALKALRDGQAPLRLAEVAPQRLKAALAEAVQAQSRRLVQRGLNYPQLWALQQRTLHRRIEQYLLGQIASGPAACLHLELAFGMGQWPRDLCDPASSPEPVVAATACGPVALRGRIDRVDLVGDDGQEGLLVIDYKTGRLPSRKDVVEGRQLQLPVYILAAEQLLGRSSVGGAFHSLAGDKPLAIRRAEAKPGDQPDDVDKSIQALGQTVARIRQGVFPPAPSGDCPSYCPMRQICHYSQARVEAKLRNQEAMP